MARTPLFSLVTRALRLARGGTPMRAPARDVDQGRRRVLAAGGAAIALPLASGLSGALGCSPSASAATPVAIIGAGMAGLHAAHRLQQRGLTATVFEASPRVGGRMYTDRTTFAGKDGQHAELGGELISTGHRTMHDLAAELGIDLLDYSTDDPALISNTAYFGGAAVAEADLVASFVPIAQAIDVALSAAVDPSFVASYKDANGLGELDQMSIAAWLDSVGASGPARALLEVAYTVEYGLETSEQSALNLLSSVSTDTTSIALFGDSDDRFHAAVGSDAFTSKLAAALDPGHVLLEHRLSRIELGSDGDYTLSFDTPGGSTYVTAARVLLTLPFTKLREVELVGIDLPAVKQKAIAELGYGTNTKLLVGFSARPWRSRGSDGSSYSDLGYQSSWESSRLQPGNAGILTNHTGGQHGLDVGTGTPEKQRDAFLKQLEQVFKGTQGATTGEVTRFVWPTHPYTLGSYSAYKVGQWTTLAGSEIERVGNLLFAGEHTSVDAQGRMEGAALTGAMAAESIAQDLGLGLGGMALSIPARRIAARAQLALSEGSWRRALLRARRRPAR